MQDIIGGGGGDGDGRRLRPHHQQTDRNQVINCPRCDSTNTKFCYYNNYNLTQPRHFCKNCRRYWTNGGILRNVPVGGGCRKSKRSSSTKHLSDLSSSASNLHSVSNNLGSASSSVHPTAFSSESQYESRSDDPSTASEFVCTDVFSDGWNLNRKDDWLWASTDMTESTVVDGMKMPEIRDMDQTTTTTADLTGSVDDEAYWNQLQWTHHSFYLP